MGTADDATGGRGPATIAHALAQALGDMQAATAAPAPADRLLYSGTHHETVPRALLFDGRLTPLERNAWQLLRLQVSAEGVAAMRTYEQLRPHLASIPCGTQASHETIARALSVLRLTRWLSLVRRRRDPASGRLLGNVYVLHDAPLTPFEAMHLDAEYLGLVSQALRHASATVKRVSIQVLQEIAEDPLLQERTLPSRLDALMGQLRTLAEAHNASYPQPDSEEGIHESEEGVRESEEGTPVTFFEPAAPSSDSEDSEIAGENAFLRIPNKDSTVRIVRTKAIYKNTNVRTVTRVREATALQLPAAFLALDEAQQSAALVALQPVEPRLRQAILDEWVARCRNSHVRKPAGYLFGIIQRALRGEFNPSAIPDRNPADDEIPLPAAPAPKEKADPEVVLAHLRRLRTILRNP